MAKRKINGGLVSPVDAAYLLGYDLQTLYLCLQAGDWPEIGGSARKSSADRDCYIYDISKFKLFTYLGYDVHLSVQEAIKLVESNSPPWIDQSLVMAHMMVLSQQSAQQKKDA